MTDPHPDVLRARRAVDGIEGLDPQERVAALEEAAAALDAALADNAQ